MALLTVKKFGLIFCIFSLFTFAFAQENPNSEITEDSQEQEVIVPEESTEFGLKHFFSGHWSKSLHERKYTAPENFADFANATDLILQFSPGLYINPFSSELNSGPTAPIYPFAVGFNWPNYTFFSIQPTLSFFTMYNLWYDGKAYPAEIENRTATTFDFLLNIPFVFSLYLGLNRFQIAPGIGILARTSILANNVNAEDSGFTGSASEDVNEINNWFWQKGRFVYLSASLSWIREFSENSKGKGGPTFSVYIPVASFFNEEAFLGSIVSLGLKIAL